ncbi:MAG: esterase-like activity of phytase family protein [Prevotella sp.]|nr:esterase-like activity of phytase family protein [Prevotella sp.]
MMRKTVFCLLTLIMVAVMADAQTRLVKEHRQKEFPEHIPAGNYSGITWLGEDEYAVVSDKAKDGFLIFKISIDPNTGVIKNATLKERKENGNNGRDAEDIAFFPSKKTLFVVGESDNQAREYDLNGKRTGRMLKMPKRFLNAGGKYGVESVTYNGNTHRFWITTESTLKADGQQAAGGSNTKNRLRLQAFTEDLQPAGQYLYEMDAPVAKNKSTRYAMGCSALTALDNGDLLVMEREFYVPNGKLGAFVNSKIYCVHPQKENKVAGDAAWNKEKVLKKQLICQWRTSLGLFVQSIANFEGMCLGPKLSNGDQVIVLVADSQDQYGGVLCDWLKTIVIKSE